MALRRRKPPRRKQEGQALIEYIMLLAIVVTLYALVAKTLSDLGVAKKLTTPITKSFVRTYRYGHPKAAGYEEGTPKKHPRVPVGEENFRIFINPQ